MQHRWLCLLLVVAGCPGRSTTPDLAPLPVADMTAPDDMRHVASVDMPPPLACAETPTSCGPPGGCVDCSKGSEGPHCVDQHCGCAATSDCLSGFACDTTTHQCSVGCANSPSCNGGCCGGQSCTTGDANTRCGTNGAACVDCTSATSGHLCIDGTCGCTVAGDCPSGSACNGGVCTTACSASSPCHGGCCNAGTCSAGTAPTTCGDSGGACVGCSAATLGPACRADATGGSCGCSSDGDCTSGLCDPTQHVCVTSCSATVPCASGCCANGICVGGTGDGACGHNGATCSDCTKYASGDRCLPVGTSTPFGDTCGCLTSSDCPVGFACDTVAHTCSTSCNNGMGTHIYCNGGCCNGTTCVAGNSNDSCGGDGNYCQDCGGVGTGGSGCFGQKCGCIYAYDCPAATACNLTTHACEPACGDANHTDCDGCCNNGVCVDGTAPTACGASGSCVTCSGSSNACLDGAACSAWSSPPTYGYSYLTQSQIVFGSGNQSPLPVYVTLQGVPQVVRSLDGGTSWAYVNDGLDGTSGGYGIAQTPIGWFMTAMSNGTPTLFSSVDGSSWTLVDGAPPEQQLRYVAGLGLVGAGYDLDSDDARLVIGDGSSGFVSQPIVSGAGPIGQIDGTSSALYATTTSGSYGVHTTGLFRSGDGGASWTEIDAGLPTTKVIAIAVAPSNPAVIYVTVSGNDAVTYLFASTDSGAHWSERDSGVATTFVVLSALAVKPDDPLTVYVGDSGSYADGLFKTSDGGVTWTRSGFNGRVINTIAISPTEASLVYVGVDDSDALYVSTTGG